MGKSTISTAIFNSYFDKTRGQVWIDRMIYIWACPNLAGLSSNGVPTPRRTIFFWRYAEKWHHSSCGSRIQDAPIMDDYTYIYIYIHIYIYTHTHTGWWFGTFFIFHSIWDVIRNPLTFIFFRGVGIPPTSIHFHQIPMIFLFYVPIQNFHSHFSKVLVQAHLQLKETRGSSAVFFKPAT